MSELQEHLLYMNIKSTQQITVNQQVTYHRSTFKTGWRTLKMFNLCQTTTQSGLRATDRQQSKLSHHVTVTL